MHNATPERVLLHMLAAHCQTPLEMLPMNVDYTTVFHPKIICSLSFSDAANGNGLLTIANATSTPSAIS